MQKPRIGQMVVLRWLWAMALRKGVTFLFDHLHRRSQNSEGYDTYPKVVIQSHERFTHRIGESIEAKVEVIYGAKVKDRIFKRQDRKFTILPLWGPWEGVLLYLDP
jgi:hypothetical protein